jgi:nucleotide-binding universal stress UspA family protein
MSVGRPAGRRCGRELSDHLLNRGDFVLHTTEGLRLATACRNVLVPLNGSREAESGLWIGQWLARRFGAELHLVIADVRAIGRYWYEPYLKNIAGDALPAVPHWTDERDVVSAIRTTARHLEPCVVCIATHGRSRTAAVVGSTFAHLAVAGDEPLVAIGPRPALPPGPDPCRTVVCVDRGASSVGLERLVDRATMWARALGHSLTLVTVARRDDRIAAEDHLQRLAADPGIDDLAVETLVLDGPGGPHTVLPRYLAERPATFLATATHGRIGASRALLGSEAARIVHHSPIPVLVVPPPAAHHWGAAPRS